MKSRTLRDGSLARRWSKEGLRFLLIEPDQGPCLLRAKNRGTSVLRFTGRKELARILVKGEISRARRQG